MNVDSIINELKPTRWHTFNPAVLVIRPMLQSGISTGIVWRSNKTVSGQNEHAGT